MNQKYLIIVLLAMTACGTPKKSPAASENAPEPAVQAVAAQPKKVEAAQPQETDMMRKPLVDNQKTDFSLQLLATGLRQGDPKENLVLSPYSAGVALSLLKDGADGQTRQALTETLCYSTYAGTEIYSDSLNIVSTANSIWVRKGITFKDSYLDYVRGGSYGAQVETRDFASRATVGEINAWCADQTHGRIPSIVDELTPELAAILLNALYFKAPWAEEFDKDQTRKETFHGAKGDKQVDFMHKTSRNYAYADPDGWQIASLPYKNHRYAMLVALPPVGADLTGSLDVEVFNYLLDALHGCQLALSLPKFKIETSLVMNNLLSAMGAAPIFEDSADFTRMSATPMAVSRVLQKCFIEVGEEGTEAAAVTGAFMRLTSVARPEPPVVMNVDRPFLFAIYDVQTRLILFEGRIANI